MWKIHILKNSPKITIIVQCSIQNSPSSVLVFLKGWTLATLEKYPFCSSFQVDEWPGTTMGTNQPTSLLLPQLELLKSIIFCILAELLQQNIDVKCAKYNVCFFVFTFPLDCCLASQRPRWAIRTSCGGNTANGTQNTTTFSHNKTCGQNRRMTTKGPVLRSSRSKTHKRQTWPS